MRDLEDITSRLQTSAGVQNGPPNQATAKRIQEILRDLEASVQKNERLTDMIHKLEAQMQALS